MVFIIGSMNGRIWLPTDPKVIQCCASSFLFCFLKWWCILRYGALTDPYSLCDRNCNSLKQDPLTTIMQIQAKKPEQSYQQQDIPEVPGIPLTPSKFWKDCAHAQIHVLSDSFRRSCINRRRTTVKRDRELFIYLTIIFNILLKNVNFVWRSNKLVCWKAPEGALKAVL